MWHVARTGKDVLRSSTLPTQGCFDVVYGPSLFGWAFDTDSQGEILVVEAVCADGRVVGTARADVFRGDLLAAGCGVGGRCSFKLDVSCNITDLVGQDVYIRRAGTDEILPGSPKVVTLNPNYHYLFSREERARSMMPRLRARLDRETAGLRISIIMPVFNTKQEWLVEALESVRTQWCSNWELICVDDASTESHVQHVLTAFARADRRIRVLRSRVNLGIAKATNLGLRAARSDYVTFVDHDDFIEPHAVWKLLRAIQTTKADLLYSDEVVTSESIRHILDIRARPAFSHDFYLSHPYFVHMICVKRSLAHSLGGWDETMEISADVDFVLRVIEKSAIVAHVPSVLYRWRTHTSSAGHSKQDQVTRASLAALQRHLDRTQTHALASAGVAFNQFHIRWPTPKGRTLIVIPTKNGLKHLRTCVKSIEKLADSRSYRLVVIDHQSEDPLTRRYLRSLTKRHVVMPYVGSFNFSRMNNAAVEQHGDGCDYVLFMNNDVEAIERGWLDRMTSLAARRDVGIVGPIMLFADRRIQHAGVIIGFSEAAEHVGKFVDYEDETGSRTLGANCTLTSLRDFSAVTAACLMMRRAVFSEVGGFNETFAVAFNDTDLCLRVRERGYRVLYDGNTPFFHYESATRVRTNDLVHPEDTKLFQDTWMHLMNGRDPFYHPHLSLAVQDHILREDKVLGSMPPRVVHLAPRVANVASLPGTNNVTDETRPASAIPVTPLQGPIAKTPRRVSSPKPLARPNRSRLKARA